ncbi:histone deacetylase [Rhodoferax lacus]|nr:histone deacetylase [Rhodoferax lacus]
MKVFYRKEQTAPAQRASPSAHKPRLVVEDWKAHFAESIELCSFEPATQEQIARAHLPDFVKGVLGGSVANGFGNRDPAVAASMPFTSGSLLAAAEYAVLHRQAVCSPTSGFHHACYSGAGGYCTFNGLMVTALALKDAGLVDRVAILDCDAHYGDGTDSIIRTLGIGWIEHHTQGNTFWNAESAANGAYERWLDAALAKCRGCDVVLYQAGADPHTDDPLGGILTTAQMQTRDRTVFQQLGAVPLVWNLAGGYQVVQGDTDAQRMEPVLALHRQTARLHVEMFG